MAFDETQSSYQDLAAIVAERTRPVLAWVGAGLSAEAGLPGWVALKEHLLLGLRKKASTFDRVDEEKLLNEADAAESQGNPWIAFGMLRKSLGQTTYRDLVREPFKESPRVEVPEAYGWLWDLGIHGMLTLNLDRLAGRSLAEADEGAATLEFSGEAVTRLRANLAGGRRFVGNLHGVFEDTDSWVFTQRELRKLFAQDNYRGFIETCFSAFTVVLVGITANDIAVGSHLERLAGAKVELPPHYWITDWRDLQIDRWAENVGVKAIRYSADNGNHAELGELLRALRTAQPQEPDDAPPVNFVEVPAPDGEGLPDEEEILRWDAEAIRQRLNAHAQALLSNEDDDAYASYEAFSREYDQAIYRAWYTTTQVGKNQLLDYTLVDREARGAFGVVYRAVDANGNQVAVKVLLDEVRQDPEALLAFRRGVRSMRILQDREVGGMVAYRQGSEIPAFVVMDWVEGANLTVAKGSGRIDDWFSVVSIAAELVATIRGAHHLPERVLHRDIRPSNIMIEDFWIEGDPKRVVVLDFDLSWHKGASEKSVLHTTAAGFLAPEQLARTPGVSTRSALVDSFGIGMTLYFLCGGVEPATGQQASQAWADDVRRACGRLPGSYWRSVPARMTRLILAATTNTQSTRWDLGEIQRELLLLQEALEAPTRRVGSPELVAEEIAARCEAVQEYEWLQDRAEARRDSPTGLTVSVRGDLEREDVELRVEYVGTGAEDRSRLNRQTEQDRRRLREQLSAGGWTTKDAQADYASFSFLARMGAKAAAQQIDRVSTDLSEALGQVRSVRA